MVDLTPFAWLNGLSAIGVVCVGAYIGINFLLRYFKEKKRLMPYVSLIGFSLVTLYIGPLVTFISLLATGVNIDPILHLWLSYTVTPIAIMNAMWLGFDIFNPERKKQVFYIFLASGVVFWIALFGWPSSMVASNPAPPGELVDLSLRSVVLVLAIFYIISVIFILGGGFYYLRQKIEGIDRHRASYVALGFFLFGLAGILETVLSTEFVVFSRIIMTSSLICIYLGFSVKEHPAKA